MKTTEGLVQHRLYAIVPAAGATQAQPAHSLGTLPAILTRY